MQLEYDSHQEHSHANPQFRSQAVFHHWVHGLQEDLDAETWASYFFEAYPMQLVRKAGWETFHHDATANAYHKAELKRTEFRNADEIALITVKYGLHPARSKAGRYMYRLDKYAAMILTREDLAGLRDACNAILERAESGSNAK